MNIKEAADRLLNGDAVAITTSMWDDGNPETHQPYVSLIDGIMMLTGTEGDTSDFYADTHAVLNEQWADYTPAVPAA